MDLTPQDTGTCLRVRPMTRTDGSASVADVGTVLCRVNNHFASPLRHALDNVQPSLIQ